jgi:hypothetical protein
MRLRLLKVVWLLALAGACLLGASGVAEAVTLSGQGKSSTGRPVQWTWTFDAGSDPFKGQPAICSSGDVDFIDTPYDDPSDLGPECKRTAKRGKFSLEPLDGLYSWPMNAAIADPDFSEFHFRGYIATREADAVELTRVDGRKVLLRRGSRRVRLFNTSLKAWTYAVGPESLTASNFARAMKRVCRGRGASQRCRWVPLG